MTQASLRWRVGFGAALTLAMAAGTLPQHVLAVLGPVLTDDLGISRAMLGALNTTYFALGAVCSVLVGVLVDRFGGFRLLIALFSGCGVAFLLMALSPGFTALLLAVALAGAGGALSNPVTNQLIATRLEPGRQGVLTGIKQSGVQVGAFLAGTVLPSVALALGWRGAVALCGAACLAALSATPVARPQEASGHVVGGHDAERERLPAFVLWLAAYAFLMGAGMSAFTAYLPLYAVEALGFTVPLAGLVAALIGLVAVFARVLWARYSERLVTPWGPLALIAAMATCAQLAVWSAQTLGAWLVWPAAVGFGATASAWNSVAMLAVVRRFQRAGTGRASGVVVTGFYLGLTVAPLAVGASIDRTGGYDLAWMVVAGVFALAGLLALTGTRER